LILEFKNKAEGVGGRGREMNGLNWRATKSNRIKTNQSDSNQIKPIIIKSNQTKLMQIISSQNKLIILQEIHLCVSGIWRLKCPLLTMKLNDYFSFKIFTVFNFFLLMTTWSSCVLVCHVIGGKYMIMVSWQSEVSIYRAKIIQFAMSIRENGYVHYTSFQSINESESEVSIYLGPRVSNLQWAFDKMDTCAIQVFNQPMNQWMFDTMQLHEPLHCVCFCLYWAAIQTRGEDAKSLDFCLRVAERTTDFRPGLPLWNRTAPSN
jgi:hypothetical protein